MKNGDTFLDALLGFFFGVLVSGVVLTPLIIRSNSKSIISGRNQVMQEAYEHGYAKIDDSDLNNLEIVWIEKENEN